MSGNTIDSNKFGSCRSGGSNPQESLNGRHNEDDKKSTKAVIIGRELFIAFILITAGVFGSMSYYTLKIAETTVAEEHYISVTEGALNNVQNLAENKLVHGSQIMAKHVGWAYPDAKDWPFVWLSSYWEIMEEILPTSICSGLNLAPIVMPEQSADFEDFAYAKIADTFGENSTMGATSHFGKGIWVKDDKRVRTVDNRYHDTTGVPIYPGSPYNYMAPKLQDGLVSSPYTMMNVHGFETQGLALDAVMNCSITRKERYDRYIAIHGEETKSQFLTHDCSDSDQDCIPKPKESHCSALSGMLFPKHLETDKGTAGFIATPIYPANDPFELVGYIFGIVYWIEVMVDVFPRDATGIDCVFGDAETQYTYTLDMSGNTTLTCKDDCHDPNYEIFGVSTTIIDPNLLSDGSVTYEMTCYPNKEFFKNYQTRNPSVAAFGAVGIILFTSILFFLYDFFVRREFRSKKDLFEAKRKFVRFVSHEVRTPMNSVCMGLSVLQEESAMVLGYESSNGKKRKKVNGKKLDQNNESFDKKQIKHWFDLANEISANAQASVDVLDDFLNYDKIATGEMVLEYSIIPIWTLIEDTVAEFKLPMAKKTISLRKYLPVNAPSPNRSSLFYSDDTIRKSNRCYSSTASEEDGISCMEAGCKSELLENAQKQKLVGDSVRITQVIRNLVSNAIKFSKEGGDIFVSTRFVKSVGEGRRRRAKPSKVQKTFELKSKEVITCDKTGEIVFTIKDTGAGLSRTQLKNLFGAGVQFDVNELQSGKGSGLGLYIAKGIVEQHGGSMVADSEGKGLGCTFTMRLPIYKPPENVCDVSQFLWKRRRPRTQSSFEKSVRENTVLEEGSDVEEEDGGLDCTLRSLDSRDDGMSELKILLVDDSKSNRKLLDRLMTMRGHRCEQADDGNKGLEMAMRAESFGQPYDLIFMDYEMPIMNGPDAVKHIRAHGSNVYIIGLTGNIMADDVSYFHLCGANAVLAKPFKVREFEQLVEDNLSRNSDGRIIEKASQAFEMSTLEIMEQGEMGEMGLGLVDDSDLDSTGVSELSCLDQSRSQASLSPHSVEKKKLELDYEKAKRALRDVSC